MLIANNKGYGKYIIWHFVGPRYVKNQNFLGLCLRPAGGAYSAPQIPWLVGKGLAAPPQELAAPPQELTSRSRPFGPRACETPESGSHPLGKISG